MTEIGASLILKFFSEYQNRWFSDSEIIKKLKSTILYEVK
jgi:hypothetical protein